MKKSLLKTKILLVFLSLQTIFFAQTWVEIPDSNFFSHLQGAYPSATTTISGVNYLNADHVDVLSETTLSVIGGYIADLTGVECFVNLTNLACYGNQLTSLPALPGSLINLDCGFNQLTSLPTLPNSLVSLYCSVNQLTSLPSLPSSLGWLWCTQNQLTSLPTLPSSLETLWCSYNQLTSLPVLPSSLDELYCQFNNITCLEVLPNNIYDLDISNNPLTCLPNYIFSMDPAMLNLPLCEANDLVNNPNGCYAASGIIGKTFSDFDNLCNTSNPVFSHIPVQLYDNANNLLQSTQSEVNGNYFFLTSTGDYVAKVDVSNLSSSIQVNCPVSLEIALSTSSASPLSSNNDFGLACNSFDLGVQSVVPQGWVFPGQTHQAFITVGDISSYYGLSCATGLSGEVTVTVNGNYETITFYNSPTVAGNVASYSIADFGAINWDDFGASILMDTTTQTGDEVCITVTVSTPTTGDVDLTNNTYEFCYEAVNSYDPNKKLTTPEQVLPNYQDDFTYTIYFQNTGSAPAFNVRLADTLSSNLDLSTFRVVAGSHPYTYSLNAASRLLTVRYVNIMLPDSTSDLAGSIGYIQYKAKPVANLGNGSIIENTAYIYFDFNAPIITNTTENLFTMSAGIKENNLENVNIYPNPSNGVFTIRFDNNATREVFITGLMGKVVYKQNCTSASTSLALNDISAGVYNVNVIAENGAKITKRIIVQAK